MSKTSTAELKKRAEKCDDTPDRAAVLANIEGSAYSRTEDLETDVEHLEELDKRRAEAAKR